MPREAAKADTFGESDEYNLGYADGLNSNPSLGEVGVESDYNRGYESGRVAGDRRLRVDGEDKSYEQGFKDGKAGNGSYSSKIKEPKSEAWKNYDKGYAAGKAEKSRGDASYMDNNAKLDVALAKAVKMDADLGIS